MSQGLGGLLLALSTGLCAATAIQNGKSLEDCDTTEKSVEYAGTGQSTSAHHEVTKVLTAYSPWSAATADGDHAYQSTPYYEAGNSTIQAACATCLPPAEIVQTMYTANALLTPAKPKTTTAPEPSVACRCAGLAQLVGDDIPAGSRTNLSSIPRYNTSNTTATPSCSTGLCRPANAVQTMRPQESLQLPTKSCSCYSVAPTYSSPRVERTQTKLDTGVYQPKAPHLEKPHSTLHIPSEHVELPGQKTLTRSTRQSNPSHSDSDSETSIVNYASRTTLYIIHSQTLQPGAAAIVRSGMTYSLPATRGVPETVVSGTTFGAEATRAVVFVNGEAKVPTLVEGLRVEDGVGRAASETNLSTGSPGMGSVGTAGLGGGEGTERGTQTSSSTSPRQTGGASERLKMSVLCLSVLLLAVVLL